VEFWLPLGILSRSVYSQLKRKKKMKTLTRLLAIMNMTVFLSAVTFAGDMQGPSLPTPPPPPPPPSALESPAGEVSALSSPTGSAPTNEWLDTFSASLLLEQLLAAAIF
jgi:hypothetical protein